MTGRPAETGTPTALRAVVHGLVQDVAFRDATVACARELGVLGWVRNEDDGTVRVHAEGEAAAVRALRAFLGEGPPGARVDRVDEQTAKVEGHEQFAVRGVPAGAFAVREHATPSHHFELRLEVDGVMRRWALPKGPSMDPGARRLAVEDVADDDLARNAFEGPADGDAVLVWDRGSYEQGGRVPWPEALDRGHAVFVLHGEKLRGGFALQRTRGTGVKAQWLLLKRRDDHARRGSDIVTERPGSVVSGTTLDEPGLR